MQSSKPTTLIYHSGFTLIEMSIVLVIIGLIVGGILTGQDVINAARIRAQISQIEKYQTAVHTFQSKYQYLPGDIPDPMASQFGFQARGTYAGQGDGNGVIEGNCQNVVGHNWGFIQSCGETPVFWQDLSEANLLDTTIFGFDQKGAGYPGTTGTPVNSATGANVAKWFPSAKIGAAFVYVYGYLGINHFVVSSVTQISWELVGDTNPNVTVYQANAIDSKIDDGLPQSGEVTACYLNGNVGSGFTYVWAAGNGLEGADGSTNCAPTTTATPYLNTNCFDNNNTAGGVQKYSVAKNANLPNCALSFQFQ